MSAGESALLDQATFAQLIVDPVVLYGDLDGDGDDEAVVRATCAYGANGAEDTVQVWSASGAPAPADRHDHRRAPTRWPTTAASPRRFSTWRVDGDEVLVTYGVYDEDAPHCCPTGQAVVTYELDGGLSVVGRPQVDPIG